MQELSERQAELNDSRVMLAGCALVPGPDLLQIGACDQSKQNSVDLVEFSRDRKIRDGERLCVIGKFSAYGQFAVAIGNLTADIGLIEASKVSSCSEAINRAAVE